MIQRMLALLLSAVMLLSMAACKHNQSDTSAETEPTSSVTEPSENTALQFDLKQTDLEGIGELLAEKDENERFQIQLDGLCTPVMLELCGTDVMSITAYGITVPVAEEANEYRSIYGNLWPAIYDHEGMILLNIWHDDIGYSCVLFPDGSYMESYPGDEYSVMIYVDEDGQLVQYQFALKFQGIDQWETGPIDTAISRDEFYYSIDDAFWKDGAFSVVSTDSFTISDCYDLDEIFRNAKANGLYPEFETLDQLLADNAAGPNNTDEEGPDSLREEVSFFDEQFAAYDYDGQHNLLNETYFERFFGEYFTKTHTYDQQNRELSGVWSFQGEEVYRYTNSYDKKGHLTDTVWYQAGREVERISYTHNSKGGYTKTFFRNGEKQYTYTFDESGELTGHSVYKDGKQIKTDDVTKLVKTQLLTDLWLPSIDNGATHEHYRYNGTVPTAAPEDAQVTTSADGSYILSTDTVDEEDGTITHHEYSYDKNDCLLKVVHSFEGEEYLRDEYQYNSEGLLIRQTTYHDGEQSLARDYEYNELGQLIRMERHATEPEIEYIYEYDEAGNEISKPITYNHKTELYRYNDRGLLAETVAYADGAQYRTDTYEYDANGYLLPSRDTYQYVYNAEGALEGIWLIYDDYAAGMALLRSHTVYVTPENACQLQEIMRTALTWL